MVLAFLFFELISISEPALTFEECLYIWINVGFQTVSPVFMFLSISTIFSAVLAAIFMVLGFVFAYLERKETEKT